MMSQQYDNLQVWCANRGMDLPFRYCRTIANGLPCPQILDCWEDRFDAKRYIGDHYNPEEITAIFQDVRSRLSDMVEMVARATRARRPGQRGER